MKSLTEDVIDFFHKQSFVVVATLDKKGFPHSACKGIVKINRKGRAYLLDLYKGQTFKNLKQNPNISITAVDEHKFRGYSLKGKAKIAKREKLSSHVITAWEKRITQRITQRVLKNISGVHGHPRHPEILMPKPEYMIVMDVEEVVDLTPHHLQICKVIS